MTTETYAVRLGPPPLTAPRSHAGNRTDPTIESYLTRRQVVVLRYLAQGRDIVGIARELGYSPSTIKKEVHVTIRQCHARNRAHAVAIAIRAGII